MGSGAYLTPSACIGEEVVGMDTVYTISDEYYGDMGEPASYYIVVTGSGTTEEEAITDSNRRLD